MASNENDFKVAVEAKLKKIKEYNLDIAILRRRVEEFSSQNYIERDHRKYTIEDLNKNIGMLEKELEEDLTVSKETKIDTPVGWVDFQAMPDNWVYDVTKLMAFLKTLPEKIANKFIQVTTTLQKAELKKAIIADNPDIFEKSKITDLGAKLYLIGEPGDEDYPVEGIEIERQKPKFHYKIRSD